MPLFPTVVLGVSVLAAPLAALIGTGAALAQANPPGQQMAPSQAQPPPREEVESDHARGTKVGPSSQPQQQPPPREEVESDHARGTKVGPSSQPPPRPVDPPRR
jgi:hypothetical protein